MIQSRNFSHKMFNTGVAISCLAFVLVLAATCGSCDFEHESQENRETSILITPKLDESIMHTGGFDIVQVQNAEQFENLTRQYELEYIRPEDTAEVPLIWRANVTSEPLKCNDPELPRLSKHLKPKHYDLTLSFKNNSDRFYGFVRISLEKQRFNLTDDTARYSDSLIAANQIVLYAGSNIDVKSVWVFLVEENKSVKVTDICRQGENLKILLAEDIAMGSRAQLWLSFSGLLDDSQRGLGVFRATERSGTSVASIATQLEPTYARRVFPCFDEPALKATFNLSIIHPENLTVLANTKPFQKINIVESNLVLTKFVRTPRMSTYLLAFSLGSFTSIERWIKNDQLLVRVFASPDRVRCGELALDVACDSILWMEDYTGIPYPLDKLDIVGVDNLRSAAMENWGLITYQEDALCFDPVYDDWEHEDDIVVTIAHEVAHMWFGNLVTMDWWTELWLNEGFAEYFGYKIAREVYKKINFEREYLAFSVINGLMDDLGNHSHPIQRSGLDYGRSIEDNFDAITYSKAGAVLRMLEQTIGEEKWKKSLRLYLKTHQFSNSKRADLIGALASQKLAFDVDQFFGSWFDQVGFPLVTVELRGREIHLRQERALKQRNSNLHSNQTTWLIPITISFGNLSKGEPTTSSFMMTSQSMTLALPDWFNPRHEGSWIKVNKDFVGFYFVAYSAELMAKLRKPLEQAQVLSAADRLSLIAESSLSANEPEQSDQIGTVLSWNCGNDPTRQQFILSMVDSSLEKLLHLSDRILSLCPAVLSLPEKKNLASSGFSTTTRRDNIVEATALKLLVSLGDEFAIKDALTVYDASRGQALNPNLSRAIYSAVARNGTDEQFEKLFERYQRSPSGSDREKLASALGESQREERLRKALCWLKKARRENTADTLCSMLDSPEGSRFLEHQMESNTESLRKLMDLIADDSGCRAKALSLGANKAQLSLARASRLVSELAC